MRTIRIIICISSRSLVEKKLKVNVYLLLNDEVKDIDRYKKREREKKKREKERKKE